MPEDNIVLKIDPRRRLIAGSALRALPPGVDARLDGDRVVLASDDMAVEALRRSWKAALATEIALVEGAAQRGDDLRMLVG